MAFQEESQTQVEWATLLEHLSQWSARMVEQLVRAGQRVEDRLRLLSDCSCSLSYIREVHEHVRCIVSSVLASSVTKGGDT